MDTNHRNFVGGDATEKLLMIDADVFMYRKIALGKSYKSILEQLIKDTAWRQESVTMYGKSCLQPRLIAWYGDGSYAYSGITLRPAPWTILLLDIKTRIENVLGHEFNSVLLNYYRDHTDCLGMHSDNETELGRQPVIASLSLGEERTFLLKHKTRKDVNTIKLRLPSGSLLVMKGDTQTYWRHGIAKERSSSGPRVNLTFRKVL